MGQGPIDGARHLGLTRRHSIELSACCFPVSCSFVVVKRHSVCRQFPPFREVCSYRSGNVGYNLVSRRSREHSRQLSARCPPPPPRKRRLDVRTSARMLRRVAPRVSAFAAQRARGMCDMTEGVTVDMVCRVFSCKARRSQRTASSRVSDSAPRSAVRTRARPPTRPPTHPSRAGR